MKNYSKIVFIVIIMLGFNTPCSANPLSSVISFFQRDLVVTVLYKNHNNLIQGSEVYLADDPENQKVLIGKVNKITLVDSQMTKVEIIIDKEYKEQIFENTAFVLMSTLFSENSNTTIVAVPSLDASKKTPLKSGSSVKGITFLEYKIALAGQELKNIMTLLKKQNNELLNQLQQYIDAFNSDAFQKKIDDLVNEISEFSAEQKETFKNEVLPSLRKTFNSMMKKLQEQNDLEKSKDLEKQLKEIEDIVDA